jgi:hypothetical protein
MIADLDDKKVVLKTVEMNTLERYLESGNRTMSSWKIVLEFTLC